MTNTYERLGTKSDDETSTLIDRSQTIKPRSTSEVHQRQHAIYKDCNYISYNYARVVESQIFSNLTLQKLIYYRAYFSIVFFYIMLYIYIYKWWVFAFDAFNLVRLIIIWPWALFEIGRLYSGYYGNIKETFPDLISFLVLSVIAEGPLIALIAFPKWIPVERAFLIIAIVLTAIEFIIGIFALSRMVKSQTAMFYLRSPVSNYKIEHDKDSRSQKDYEKKIIEEEKERNRGSEEPTSILKKKAGGPKKRAVFASQENTGL